MFRDFIYLCFKKTKLANFNNRCVYDVRCSMFDTSYMLI